MDDNEPLPDIQAVLADLDKCHAADEYPPCRTLFRDAATLIRHWREDSSGWQECLSMVRDRLKAYGCTHGYSRDDATPPMMYDDWLSCVVAKAKQDGFAAGAAAMRERCAKICWEESDRLSDRDDMTSEQGALQMAALDIRSEPLPTPEGR